MMLSIIIPAYNEEKIIRDTINNLKKIFNQKYSIKFKHEIIICDNNSTDNTASISRQLGIKIIFEKHNNIACARNTGAKIAKGDWLLFIDADAFPNYNLIQDSLNIISNGNFIGFGSTYKHDKSKLLFNIYSKITNFNLKRTQNSLGSFLGCNKIAFNEIGGFNNKIYYLEEMEFIDKLKELGKKTNKGFITLTKNPYIVSGRRENYMSFLKFVRLSLSGLLKPKIRYNKKYWEDWYKVRT